MSSKDDKQLDNEVDKELVDEGSVDSAENPEAAADEEPAEPAEVFPPFDYSEGMRDAYLGYSLLVIQDRALPDVRDGLKPVQRRVLYALNTLGLKSNAKHKKSANVVGNVMAHYHPHGDSSIYGAMVLMAQDFRFRVPLVDGQGNFGSLEDPPAAMRYSEARLSAAGDLFFNDCDPEVVKFVPNFDESKMQPSVLPSAFPNLLVNGSQGIAVGMSTLMVPHNPGEIIDGLVVLLDNPKATIADLRKKVKGPDFPSGGLVSSEGLKEMYETGRGRVSCIGKLHIEQLPGNREQMVITDLPYEVNKETLLLRIRDLYLSNKFEELTDMKDETGRDGVRILLRLKRGVDTRLIEDKLRKETTFQKNFAVQMTVLVDRQPRTLNLKEMMQYFVDFRREVVTRRTQKRLREVQARLHILDALLKAISVIDKVVQIIKNTPELEATKKKLRALLTLDNAQVEAILALRLQRLGGLDRKRYQEESKALHAEEKELKAVLRSKTKVDEIVRAELQEVKHKFGTPRLSTIKKDLSASAAATGMDDKDLLVTLTNNWRAVAFSGSVRRGGFGLKTGKDETIACSASGRLRDDYLVFTDKGNAYRLHGPDLYVASAKTVGQNILRHVNLKDKSELPVSLLLLDDETPGYCLVTKQGKVKRVAAADFARVHGSGVKAMGLTDDDALLRAMILPEHLILMSRNAKILRFDMAQMREMGRAAGGVRGISLGSDDAVIAALGVEKKDPNLLLLLTEQQKIKAVSVQEIPLKGRATQGVAIYKASQRIGLPTMATIIPPEKTHEILIVSPEGNHIAKQVKELPLIKRSNAPRNCGPGFARLYRDADGAPLHFIVLDGDTKE